MQHKKIMDKAQLAFIHMAANPSKETAYRAVCLLRACAVRVIDELAQTQESRRQFAHIMNKMPKPELPEDVEISVLNPYEPHEKCLLSQVIELGEMLTYALDGWQMHGATLQDLRTICNGSGQFWYRAIVDMERGSTFSRIVGAGCTDYKDNGEWIETTPNAPLTICLREWILDKMLHTECGRKAADEAFKAVFPELAEKVIYRYVDSEGTVHYLDKDGAEIGYEPPKK